ncbi:hypothetical protein BKA56DRAFT_289382, partial [Ilyonectria sp. MPI-CAGE-AT-0026]
MMKPSMLQEAAVSTMENHLRASRGDHKGPSSATTPWEAAVIRSLAPFFAGQERIVFGMLGNLTPDTDLRDLALAHGLSDLASFAAPKANTDEPKTLAAGNSTSSTTPANKEAIAFRRELFQIEPTGVVQRMVIDDEVGSFPSDKVRQSVVKFMENQPRSFDISRTSVHVALRNANAFADIPADQHSEVSDAVKELQTAQAIAVHPDAIKPLREAGLFTAFAVSSMSEKGFVESLSGKVDADVAKAIHLRATNSRIRNDHALVSLLQTTRGTGIAALDGNVSLGDRKKMLVNKLNRAVSARDYHGNDYGQADDDSDIVPKPVVDLEALFGSLDYCECSDCNSVNSPAAYFVEVLQFLRNNNLHWDKTKWPHSGDPGIADTALDALFARRPDLGNIELTCANTNTVLPYIDLANEVMESFVVHKQKYAEDKQNPKRVTLDVFNIEDEVSSELLAEPQHTNYTAYCILKDAVYPIVNAPYHQAMDEARILLEYMGTSRYELVTMFPAPYVSEDGSNPPSADDLKLRDQYRETLDRISSSEFWKMSQTEYIAITRQSYWAKEFWVIKKKVQITDDEYQSHIRHKPAWVYWGYGHEVEMQSTDSNTKTGLMFVKAQLLQRAYVTYADLVSLVKTRYMNPNMPRGRNRTILESIRFSYKYLCTLVDWECNDTNKKFRRLAKFLACWKPWAKEHGVELDEDDDSTLCLCESEILCWLKTWFEAVGKLVVLESGDIPLLPIEGHLVLNTVKPPPPVPHLAPASHPAIPATTDPDDNGWQDVGYLSRDGKIRKENGEEVAHVSPDGTLRDNDEALYATNLTSQQSLYIVDPTVTSFQNPDDIVQNHILARVIPSTSVVVWNVVKTQEDEQPVPIHYLAATETCNIDNVTIQHLDGSHLTVDEWDRTQAFLRLWRRVGWTIDELDRALAGIAQSSTSSDTPTDGTPTDVIDDWNQVIDSRSCLCPVCGHANSDCCCKKPDTPDSDDCCDLDGPEPPIYITPETLEQLVSIKQLVNLSGLPITQLLTLWYDIPIEGDPSLYSKLFLVHNISGIDPVFKANSDGDYLTTPTKISDHLPVILAALRINAETLAAIMKDAQVPDDLTLDTISTLYKYTVLGRLLSAKPILLPRIMAICGKPFVAPKTTLAVTQLWQQIRDKGYTLAQMDYLLNNINNPLKPLGPTTATVLKATKTMMDGIFQINTEHADVSATETPAIITTLLAAKIPLIFDPDVTSAILGLLNGTTVYTTDAPPNLDIKIPDSLNAKLQYVTLTKLTPVRATVTVTGILTAEEMAAAKALSTNSDWAASLARIAKKPGRFFDETLFGIFSDKEAAKTALLQGDVPPLPPPPPPTDPSQISPPPRTTGSSGTSPPVDKSTAGPKSLFFLQGLLPFLRKTLADRLIIDTVSGATSISDPDLRVLLLSKLITIGSDSRLAIDALRDIANAPPASQSSFSGYLVANATADFTFVAGGFKTEPPPLLIDNQPVRLVHQQEDPTNVWCSDPISLTSGKLYDFTVSGQPASNLQWKTARSPVSNIPNSALLPGHASDSTMDVLTRLYKASLVINIMSITTPEVNYISSNAADFSNINFNCFTLDTWRRLVAYTTLRDSLPATNLTLIDFFKWAKKPGKPQDLAGQISAVTTWNKDVVGNLIAKDALNLVDVATFVNEVHLVELQKAMAVQAKIGVDPDLLFQWSKPLSFFWKQARAVAESIRKTLRARYDVATWEQVAQPLFNTLRHNQRDALIAFLLMQKPLRQWGVRDADSLFEFFLIDVQMGSCLQTSRIKQAISTAQLFVQRCLLALEDDHGLAGFSFDKQRWSWMQNYRVWEANRKVFLWPENWLDPTLRDDKSELFLALESQLLQKDLNPRALQDALKQYLFGVDQVSNLQVIGLASAFGNPVKPATPFGAYHELKTPYALYNWEMALHAPMLLVNKLLSIQKFDEALAVAKWVFDPFADRSSPAVPGDLWHFPPFKNVLAENELEKTFAMLEPNTVVEQGNVIGEWRDNPFEPHVVARARRQAYMKWFAMRYIEILITYGDWYFTQNTLETIPMAIQLYVQASHLYGPRAQRIPRLGKKKIETYNSLLDQWDGFSNAIVQMELAFPFSQQSDKPLGELHGKQVLANIFGFATSRYFCVPNNPKLDEVRNLIDDRLYKIRHCQDINGVVRQLPLFEPPIDPGLLVQAAAAGLSFASVISDLNSPMGNYRFPLLLQKALELCNELKSMNGVFLSVKEKRDAEALSNLRAAQEVTVAGLVMELKKQALEDVNLTLAALQQSRLAPVCRLNHFVQLLGEDLGKVPSEDADFSELQNRYDQLTDNAGFKLTSFESQDMDKANDAALQNSLIGEIEALSSFLNMIPTTNIHSEAWGFGPELKWGPSSFAQGAAGTARRMRIIADSTSADAANANRMANFLRQLQDRVHQANNAGYEIKNIDAQIHTQAQKVAMAEQDITNQQQAMDNAAEVRDFLRGKYTNEALYSWMEDGIRALYYQTYTLAYQLAKKAERAYAFERALDPSQASFVQFGYWDPNRDGLLAAERLYVGLKQLEAAHQADRGHDYEITKHVSLRQLAPLALLQLRASGSCEVALPEVLFDMDFPGHFQRRIRSVALTIPCVVGPYTSLSCTLRLLGSEMRVLPTAGSAADYPHAGSGGSDGGDDPRFRTVTSVPIASIAVSSASNDAGVFELG